MTDEEQRIVEFFKGSSDSGFARRETPRGAVKRTVFEKNPRWAEASLTWLLDKKIIEMNDGGQFRPNTGHQYRRS